MNPFLNMSLFLGNLGVPSPGKEKTQKGKKQKIERKKLEKNPSVYY